MPSITFALDGPPSPEDVPVPTYVLRFSGGELVVFSQLEFVGSPGSIGLDDVRVVIIEECSFR